MRPASITPDNTVFAIVSFEGPDIYSQAGGLGARVANLSDALTGLGFDTHLFFIGDPRKKGEETLNGGKLTLHRWCQWISERCPVGVYQGEEEKLKDFNDSLPGYLTENLIKPATRDGKLVIVLGEEYQTCEAMCRIGDRLRAGGLSDRVVMFWNANNIFGFEGIDWAHLTHVSTLTTVSRYMKRLMQGMGLDSLIIPNGIPSALLNKVAGQACATLRTDLAADLVLCKIARWDPAKGWDSAVEATARLKASGVNVKLIARGSTEPYGEEVAYRARSLGLKMKDVGTVGETMNDGSAMGDTQSADILNLKGFCPQSFLRVLYRGSDAVLANSNHEPFGLVGLEAMAAGGVAFTGGTGEDYAVPFRNSIVLETRDPKEIEAYVRFLQDHPVSAQRIRRAARRTARQYTWEHVIDILVRKLEYQARIQGFLAPDQPTARTEPKAANFHESLGPGDAAWWDSLLADEETKLNDPESVLDGPGFTRSEFNKVYRQVRQLKQEVTLNRKALECLAEIPGPSAFWCHDGRVFRNMKELGDGLIAMSDETFTYHSNLLKNDFSSWVKEVIRDKKLSNDLDRVQNRVQAANAVAQRLCLLRFRSKQI